MQDRERRCHRDQQLADLPPGKRRELLHVLPSEQLHRIERPALERQAVLIHFDQRGVRKLLEGMILELE